ncbi:MAG: PHP domain-containing protein [Candidatus Zixiibacteriota bacterium]|nr:MAG: PHP domain-containing protein [candidate division Zixibacteria bacterium]
MVRRSKLVAFSICDHDSYEAYLEIRKLLKKNDPELVPGVELSAGSDGEDIHILGYCFDPDSDILGEAVERFREGRNRRGEIMLKRLKMLGIDITMDLVREIAGGSAIGRPHVADALVRVKAVEKFEDAFSHYIGLRGPAYVPKENLTPGEAIELIHRANGLAVLAHPGIAAADKYINEFIGYGMDGIEVYHPRHTQAQREHYMEIAKERHLLSTGGSDYHGREGRYGMIGSQPVPVRLLTELKEKSNLENRGSS